MGQAMKAGNFKTTIQSPELSIIAVERRGTRATSERRCLMQRRLFYRGFVIAMSLCAAAVLSSGCGSSGRVDESEKAVDSMQDVQDQLAKAKEKVTRVNAALDGLTAGPDLQKAFSEYTDALDDLQSAIADAKSQGQDMRDRRQAYLNRWQEEAANVQNPDVKASLDQRRQKVADEFDKIHGLGEDVRTAYTPYMQDCQDIKKALAVDLTPAGAQGLAPVITKAKAEGVTVIQKLDALSAEMDTVIGKMSPAGATPAK
jgi:DNA repair exonuclease SbcCD ATPase subunit